MDQPNPYTFHAARIRWEMAHDKPKPRTLAVPTNEEAVFTLTFTKGLADRNRLPIEQVLRTLSEFQEMVRELGKRVQRASGMEDPDGDFGIEIVAGPGGYALQKGSVITTAVATKDVGNARTVFQMIVANTRTYTKKIAADDSVEGAIVARRMYSIARLQTPAKSLVAFQLKGGAKAANKAVLDERAYIHLLKARKRVMRVDGLQLYGKLRQLKDLSKTEHNDGHFWGELVSDQGDVWRLRFEGDVLKRVLPLFKQQVSVVGDATYFGPARHPRLRVTAITHDPERDYIKAFDEIRASEIKLFGDATTDELLAELYG
ncbi:MAG TPA: hypothetical protein VGN16_16725 [Acidobacteriaceae bacterium]